MAKACVSGPLAMRPLPSSGQPGLPGANGQYADESEFSLLRKQLGEPAPTPGTKPPKATPRPPQGHILGIDSGVQSHAKATPRLRQSHPKAPPRLHQGSTKAPPRLHQGSTKATPSSSTTKKPELDSGLSATFYTENYFKSSLDAAPQICACQPHTV